MRERRRTIRRSARESRRRRAAPPSSAPSATTALFAAAPTAPIRAFLDLIRCLRLAAVGLAPSAPRVRAARKARYTPAPAADARGGVRADVSRTFATSPTARSTKTTKTTKTKTSTASAHRPSRLADADRRCAPAPRARAHTPSYKTHTLAQQINVVSHRPMVEERRADIHRVHHFPIFTSHDSTCTPRSPRSRRVMNARVSLFTHTR